jgi:hypothetical protein
VFGLGATWNRAAPKKRILLQYVASHRFVKTIEPCVGAFFGCQSLASVPLGGALHDGTDGPWLYAGQSVTWAQEWCLPCVTPNGPRLWTGRSVTWRQGCLPPPCWNLDLVPWGKRS